MRASILRVSMIRIIFILGADTVSMAWFRVWGFRGFGLSEICV